MKTWWQGSAMQTDGYGKTNIIFSQLFANTYTNGQYSTIK